MLPWVDSVLCGVPRSLELLTLFFLSFSLSLSFSDHSRHFISVFISFFLRPSGEQRFRRRSCMTTRLSAEEIGLIG